MPGPVFLRPEPAGPVCPRPEPAGPVSPVGLDPSPDQPAERCPVLRQRPGEAGDRAGDCARCRYSPAIWSNRSRAGQIRGIAACILLRPRGCHRTSRFVRVGPPREPPRTGAQAWLAPPGKSRTRISDSPRGASGRSCPPWTMPTMACICANYCRHAGQSRRCSRTPASAISGRTRSMWPVTSSLIPRQVGIAALRASPRHVHSSERFGETFRREPRHATVCHGRQERPAQHAPE